MFLIVTRSFPPDIGGMQFLMEGLANSLVNHGPVKIFADDVESCEKYDKSSNLNISRVSGIKLFRKFRKANIVSEFIRNNKNIRSIFVDHWKSLEHLDKSVLNNIPTFCLIHSKEINHEPGSRLNLRMVKAINKADIVVANSRFTKNLAIKSGIDENLIKIIFPGINEPVQINEEYNQEAKKIYNDAFPKLITVARLDKRKGQDNVIMALKNLKPKFPKIKYVCVGFGEEESSLEKLTSELNLKNDVCFLKNIDKNLKIALIQNSNLFIMPSRIYKKSVEGFGIAFIEAGSYKIGSIGGKDGGASDAIGHEKTGLICDGNNLSSIYDSVLKFFDNNKYKDYGNAAEEFSKKFYWNKIIKNYINLINQF